MPTKLDTKELQATLDLDIARLHVGLVADHEAGLHTELATLGGGPGRQKACRLCISSHDHELNDFEYVTSHVTH